MDFANRFESKAALKGVPHITLKQPFLFSNGDQQNVITWFQGQCFFRMKPFQIELRDFGAFHNKYNPVVYVKPAPNLPLYCLQKEIVRSFWLSYPDKLDRAFESKFNPHVTIAYRDLEPELFKKAWGEYRFKKYSAIFQVNSFHLLQHDRRQWNIVSTYSL